MLMPIRKAIKAMKIKSILLIITSLQNLNMTMEMIRSLRFLPRIHDLWMKTLQISLCCYNSETTSLVLFPRFTLMTSLLPNLIKKSIKRLPASIPNFNLFFNLSLREKKLALSNSIDQINLTNLFLSDSSIPWKKWNRNTITVLINISLPPLRF